LRWVIELAYGKAPLTFFNSRDLVAVLARFTLFLVLAASVGCSPRAPQPDDARAQDAGTPPRAAKRITAAVLADINTLHSRVNRQSGTVAGLDAVEDLVNAGLAIRDRELTLQPQLAEAVPSIENGLWTVFPDGRMATTWKIRPGATWHDGTPFTSDDLAFSAQVMQDPELPSFREPNTAFVERVATPDPLTFTVYWTQPLIVADAWFTRELGLPLPKHLLEAAYTTDKASFVNVAYWTDGFVGTGPYLLRDYERGSHLLLAANPAYVLGKPNVDVVEVKIITDTGTLAANLLAGTVDVTLGRTFSLEEGLPLRDQWREGRMEVGPAILQRIVAKFTNPNPAIIGNVQFRRALLYGTDRQQMADTLQGGMTTVAHSLLPDQPQYREAAAQIVRYDYDPRRATQLLEELGYGKGGDGVFRDAAGQKLWVEIRANGGNPNQEKALFAVADYWQRLGIDAEPLLVPGQRRLDRAYRAARPGFLLGGGPSGIDVVPALLHSSRIPIVQNEYVGTNDAEYAHPDLDALIDRYLVTIPQSERMRIIGQIVRHISEQVPIYPLYYLAEPTMIGNRLVNVAGRQTESTQAWNAHVWDVR
jgi:peptide/nickel transport system substrate-binding protein